jgi:hypothetical protein
MRVKSSSMQPMYVSILSSAYTKMSHSNLKDIRAIKRHAYFMTRSERIGEIPHFYPVNQVLRKNHKKRGGLKRIMISINNKEDCTLSLE